MTLAFDDGDIRLHHGDALTVLCTLPAESVDLCVTSPPFFGLRDYGVDGQIGLEPTPDEWVARLVAVFDKVHRVLRPWASLWIECGDSYAGASGGGSSPIANRKPEYGRASVPSDRDRQQRITSNPMPPGLKTKDLIGQPFLLAFALRDAGWYWRGMYVWAKPNPMPESVRDRCTTAHSYVLHMAKRSTYYHDAEATQEAAIQAGKIRSGGTTEWRDNRAKDGWGYGPVPARRNARSVWTIPTEPNGLSLCPECGAYWERGAPAKHCGHPCEVCGGKGSVDGSGLKATPSGGAREALGLRTGESLGRSPGWRNAENPSEEPEWCEACDGTGMIGVPVVAHYAAFPRELVRRIILVGTSERGCCQECGRPWERATKTRYQSVKYPGGIETPVAEPVTAHGLEPKAQAPEYAKSPQAQPLGRARRITQTLGWRPTCDHEREPRPAVVLDPFAGSGTSLLVAREQGRHAIGIELRESYCRMVERRLAQLSLLGGAS